MFGSIIDKKCDANVLRNKLAKEHGKDLSTILMLSQKTLLKSEEIVVLVCHVPPFYHIEK